MIRRITILLESDKFGEIALLVGRALMASPFILFGITKITHFSYMYAYVERAGVPGNFLWFVIPYQILCGIALVLGIWLRWASFLLGSFCIVATLLYHTDWRQSSELAQFMKDFAMAGGFLYLWHTGPGRLSLDHLLRRDRS